MCGNCYNTEYISKCGSKHVFTYYTYTINIHVYLWCEGRLASDE